MYRVWLLFLDSGLLQPCLGNRNDAVIFTGKATGEPSNTQRPVTGNHTQRHRTPPGGATL